MAPGIILSAWTFMDHIWHEYSVTEMHCPQSINILVTAHTGNGYNQSRLTAEYLQKIFPDAGERARTDKENAAAGWILPPSRLPLLPREDGFVLLSF
jgi:hypothetical protein